ncbi:hypothetical protein [Phyllobacterium sp. UNC302MFCol5.2]|uniref:hypothetical protein n=1 Tax=Phyllobacterium sp. UNC302MFCol5.2 TaxID=1449065 RepID=UPI000488F239|nr:hypothetical protein [Phyllobacterium sp. UNC302MFCol5.2]
MSVAADGVPVDKQALPTDADVLAQLDRIRSSAEFDVPERARRFLTYVVEETIAGRGNRIKAYSIAMEVFGRESSFDAQLDPVVRIQAGLIRRGLEHYYLVAGNDDPVIITMPKGGYIPIFSRKDPVTAPESYFKPMHGKNLGRLLERASTGKWSVLVLTAIVIGSVMFAGGYLFRLDPLDLTGGNNMRQAGPDIPKVLVEPIEDLSGTQRSANIAQDLTDEVISQLAKFKEVVVVAGRSSDASSTLFRINDTRPSFALQGRVRIDGEKLRLSTRLMNRADSSIVWTGNYENDLKAEGLVQLQGDIARSVATALAQPYGILFQKDSAQLAQSPPNNIEAYTCTLAYYRYRANLNPQTHTAVQSCLKRAVERYPGYATAWALLSLTYLDEVRFRYRLDSLPAPSLELAASAAKRATELDPQNVRGLQAEMLTYFFRGQVQESLQIGARAYAINPNDTELSGEYGFRLALSGKWDEGCKLIASAVSRNPGPSGYFEAALAVCSYMAGDYVAAEQWSQLSDLGPNPIFHIIRMAILGKLGKREEADSERKWLEQNAPAFLPDIRNVVATRILRPEDQLIFIDGLRKAGLTIPGN